MRTTVTLDPDVLALLRKAMKEKGLSFKAALNQAVRDGLTSPPLLKPSPYRLNPRRMGSCPESLIDQALSVAAELEDEEIVRKMNLGK